MHKKRYQNCLKNAGKTNKILHFCQEKLFKHHLVCFIAFCYTEKVKQNQMSFFLVFTTFMYADGHVN